MNLRTLVALSGGFEKRQLEASLLLRGDSGQLLYVPLGTRTFLGRRSYLVPDEATRERILEVHGRWRARGLALTMLLLVALFVALALVPFNPARHLSIITATLVLMVVTFVGTIRLSIREVGPLLAGPRRAFRDIVKTHDQQGQLGRSRAAVWLFSAFFVGLLALSLYAAVHQFQQGRTTAGVLLGGIVLLVYIPLIALGPYALKMRRLREENERLEAVVAERTRELQELNRTLEARVREQVTDIERLGQLKHFFAAPVAEKILSEKTFDPAKVHRRELTSVSMDLRGFTAFSETAEPEEVIAVLRTYHAEMGIQVSRHRATLEHFAGDGVMVFLNDPVEIEDHPMRALELAVALRDAMRPHLANWRSQGFDLGMGVGIATGFATIGTVGYDGRWEYAAIGTVNNLAARLCSEAKDGQIVVSGRFVAQLGERAELESLGERALKGFSRPVAAFNVVSLKVPSPVAV